MATDEEKLLVRIEASQKKFERQLAAISKSADKTSTRIERRFRKGNSAAARSFKRIDAAASRTFGRVSRLALAAAGAFGAREVTRYADAWTEVENQIKAAEQISGTAARSTSKLNNLASKTRAGLRETASLYARILRVSGDLGISEEKVAQATETVAKAFKAGGAAASEQAAGVLQLSQALSSGVLQGDELRSLRENAPLIAQAIADEFKTTIGGLKELGAQGELTASRVLQGILNAQGGIDKAFKATSPTIRDGFTIFRNSLTELIGGFDDGARASESFVSRLNAAGEYFTENAAKAERFGRQVREAFQVTQEAIDALTEKVRSIGGVTRDAQQDFIDMDAVALSVFRELVKESAGVAAFLETAFLKAVDAVGSGAVGIANAAIAAVEGILNKIIAGIQNVIQATNGLITAANNISGLSIPTLDVPLQRGLGRVQYDSFAPDGSPVDSYRAAKVEADAILDAVGDSINETIKRISDAGTTLSSKLDGKDGLGGTGKPKNANAPTIVTPSKSGGGGSKSKEENDLFEDIRRQRQDLELQIELIGKSASEVAALTAKQDLLNEVKKRGLDLDKKQRGSGETLRQEIERQAQAIGDLTDKYEQHSARVEFGIEKWGEFKDGLLDSIVAGESLSGTLQGLAQSIAKANLEAAIFGTGPLGGGSSILGGFDFGKIFGGIIPGFASGTNNAPGGVALVGERGAELVNLPKGSQVVPAPQTAQLLRQGSAGSPSVNVAPAEVNLKAINVLDPSLVGDYLTTPEGERLIVNIMRRNG